MNIGKVLSYIAPDYLKNQKNKTIDTVDTTPGSGYFDKKLEERIKALEEANKKANREPGDISGVTDYIKGNILNIKS